MAAKRIETVVMIVIIAATFCGGAVAQSSSCGNAIIGMSPCLNYITGNSSTPSSSCCSQLSNVVKQQPQCLCQVLNGGGSSLGININQTQALALPGACKVQTPPVSQCDASSPTGSPSGTADSPSGASDSPSGGGSKTVPTTNVDSSNGNATKLSFSLLLMLLFVASSAASTFTTI